MVSKKDMEDAIDNLSTVLQASIFELRKEIIDRLCEDNKKLRGRVDLLEKRVEDLESSVEVNLQYQRRSNVHITGIPLSVKHVDLEDACIGLFNNVCPYNIDERDVVACHRLSAKYDSVVIRFLNRKDAIIFIQNKKKIVNIDDPALKFNMEEVFIGEHLTPYFLKLAFKCRCLKRAKKKVIATTVVNGAVKILVDIDGKSTWLNILHENDLLPYSDE